MALNECACGCDGRAKPKDWSARLATIVEHVASARAEPCAQAAAATAEPSKDRAAPSFFVSLDAAALPSGMTALDGRLQLIISPAGAVQKEPRLHVSSDRCKNRTLTLTNLLCNCHQFSNLSPS
eukprot:SAG31_NODE_5_length_43735_cov_42.922266_20_plen_124_part_00